MTTLICNGLVCRENRIEREEILIADGRIAEIGTGIDPHRADETIDAGGAFVLPGLIDIHTHLDDRIGSFALADTYESGTRAAIENGITTLFTFVTQQPDETLTAGIERAASKARNNCHCHYMWHLTPTRFDDAGWREIDEWIARGFRTFKFYTTYRRAGIFSDYPHLEELMRRLPPRGAQLLIHCEDEALLARSNERQFDPADAFSHALTRPPEAEAEAIRRVVDLADKHRARVHIVHVSTPEGLEVIKNARGRVPVTCETAPQYIVLNEERLRGDSGHRWICSPPLRTEQRRHAMAESAAAGEIDLFATDHCAFTRSDKDSGSGDFRAVPNGLAGIGALPHLMLKLFDTKTANGLPAFSRCLSANPARVAGIYPRKGTIAVGSDADLLLLRLDGKARPIRSSYQDVHEPYPHHTTSLHFDRVLLGGATTVINNVLVDPRQHKGQCVCRW